MQRNPPARSPSDPPTLKAAPPTPTPQPPLALDAAENPMMVLRERLERADSGTRARAIGQLQRTLGNHRTSELLIQRTPAAPVLGAAETIAIIAGLSETASLLGDVYAGSLGGLSYSSPTARRLSDAGTQPREGKYRTRCLSLVSKLSTVADAHFDVEWEGNSYGEIGAARVVINKDESEYFLLSSATVTFNLLDNLIQPGGDRRTWQMGWSYDGTYDTSGSGYLSFSGTFAIDAFGNYRPSELEVKDLSMSSDSGIYVDPGKQVTVPIPPPPKNPGARPAAPAPGEPAD